MFFLLFPARSYSPHTRAKHGNGKYELKTKMEMEREAYSTCRNTHVEKELIGIREQKLLRQEIGLKREIIRNIRRFRKIVF